MTKNILQPTADQIRQFRDRKTGEPIAMLNLLKFKSQAIYADGRPSTLTGEAAYKLYGQAFERIMVPKGAKVLYSGQVRGFLIGEGEGAWDEGWDKSEVRRSKSKVESVCCTIGLGTQKGKMVPTPPGWGSNGSVSNVEESY